MRDSLRRLVVFAKRDPDGFKKRIEVERLDAVERMLSILEGKTDEECEAIFRRLIDEAGPAEAVVIRYIGRVKKARKQRAI